MEMLRFGVGGGARAALLSRLLAGGALAVLLAACSGPDGRHAFSIDATGTVSGFAYVDLNRDGAPQGTEPRLADAGVQLLMRGTGEPVGSATTDSEGAFSFEGVPVGSYRLEIGGAVLGDSLVVTGTTPEPVQVTPGGSASASIGVSYPLESLGAVGSLPAGTPVYVEGIALNTRGSLPDNALHLHDGERAIRTLGAGGLTANPGDSVRILGRTGTQGGRTVLVDGVGFRIAPERRNVQPQLVSTATAASAGGGALDAALVRIDESFVSQVVTVQGVAVVTASDGSGSLVLRIPTAHLQQAGVPVLQPGAVLSVAGVLIPRADGGAWELRTRGGGDVAVEAQGVVSGVTFFDLNGNLSRESADPLLAGVRVRLFRTADASAPVAEATSDAEGRFRIGPIDVDEYRLEVDPATVPDSLVVRQVSPATFVVPTADSVAVSIPITFPELTTAEARERAPGTTVFVQGIALNSRGAFGDQSVHLQDASGALRTIGVQPPNVLAGDRVRLRGTLGVQDGQPVLLQVTPFNPQPGGLPTPLLVSSAVAAHAGEGSLDANQVRVREAVIQSSSGDEVLWEVVLDDGTGPVRVEARLQNVGLNETQAAAAFEPGRTITVTGLLMPVPGTGSWRIRLRTGADLILNP